MTTQEFNKIAIDHIFENYNINKTAELGAYYGLSTKYIANKNKSLGDKRENDQRRN